ncbi:hypothetical protein FACS1894166_12460 [Bacilli bacterium]|nr:hypothetical protein FACS1894166_12460 [Bacilli bacterium]
MIESGDSNATPTYVQELTNTTISGSTCTTELSYTKAGVPANGSPIDIVVACTLNGATKRVQVTINPVAITTQLEFTSSNILDLDDADSTVTAKLTCPAVITGVTPDVN